jgi:replicative DNA helicase
MIDRPLPHSTEAEAAVLGAVLLEPTVITSEAFNRLDTDDFYLSAHRIIHREMLGLYASRRAVDVVTLSQRLRDKGQLEEVGGAGYLTDMQINVPVAAHLEHYVEIIEEKAARRAMIQTAFDITAQAYNESLPALSLADTAGRALTDIGQRVAGKRSEDLKPLVASRDEYNAWCKRVIDVSADLGKWLPSLREPCGRLAGGEMVLVVGSTGVGKTALAQNIALAVAPLKTALFELELPETLTYPRFLQIAHRKTLSEVWQAHHHDQADDWHTEARMQNILLCSTAGLSVDDIVRRIEAHNLRNEEPIRVVVVDYFQLLQGKGATRYERFSNAAEACKVAAKKTNAVWIVVSQIQRPGENGGYEPHLHSGKETGSLENSSGLVLGFWRDENDPATAYCRILKNTKGRSGQKVECNYHGETLHITEKFNANV